MKYSSTSPSRRPPRPIGPVCPAPPARERTRRTFSMSASTMVPTLSRYCWATRGCVDAPAAVRAAADLGEPLVGVQRVAAGGDEIDRGVEIRAGEARIGRGGAHLGVEIVGAKRRAAGGAEHVLRQHVERAGAHRRRVLRVVGDRVDRGAAFEHLEAVGRDQHGLGRLVEPVVGAADALHQPARALRRADIDDEIDVAPVDAEVERGGGDHGAQPAGRHRVLDLAALRHVERAVMQRDREAVVVDAPQLLEHHLGLHARVDEDQRGLVAPDQVVDLAERMARRMPGPRHVAGRVEHVRRSARRRLRRPRGRRAPRRRPAAAPGSG